MKTWFIAFRCLLILSLLAGVLYPLGVTVLAQGLFPWEAAGSLVVEGNRVVGSELLAQSFTSPRYFWPRPSAVDYNPLPSGASNLGPTSRKLLEQVESRRVGLLAADPGASEPSVPQELVVASGSGLDPHLSPAAAQWQVRRVAVARNLDEGQRAGLEKLVRDHVEPRTFGFLGEERINVLKLNRALDVNYPERKP